MTIAASAANGGLMGLPVAEGGDMEPGRKTNTAQPVLLKPELFKKAQALIKKHGVLYNILRTKKKGLVCRVS